MTLAEVIDLESASPDPSMYIINIIAINDLSEPTTQAMGEVYTYIVASVFYYHLLLP